MSFRRNKKLAIVTFLIFLFTIAGGIIYKNTTIKQKEAPMKQTPKILGTNTSLTPQLSPIPTASVTPTTTASASPIPTKRPTTRTIYLGMWTEGFWDDGAKQLHPEKLTELEGKIGKKVAIAHYYRGWQFLDSPTFVEELNTISSHGWRPMVSANPYYFDRCLTEGKTLYKMIADGHCDDFLRSVGRRLKEYNRPVFLRFAWEMNIDSIEWGISKTGSSPEDYIAAWRKFHDIVRQEGASNVLWVFSPNTITPTSVDYAQLYPGDQYVDWLGLDGYNWGTTQPWSSWQSFQQVYGASYTKITSLSSIKPLMLGEVNTTDKGGNKAAWYTDMLLTQIPYNYSRIKAIVLYNEDRSMKEQVNWLITSSTESLSAFSTAIKSPQYLSSF